MKRIGISLTLFALALFPGAGASGAEDTNTHGASAMKGITGVEILIERVGVGGAKIGLTEEAIRTDVELKLRSAGMRVLTSEEDLPGNPALVVAVNITDSASAASVSFTLVQDVLLERTRMYGCMQWLLGKHPALWGIQMLDECGNLSKIRLTASSMPG
jgi:hypothetical protein